MTKKTKNGVTHIDELVGQRLRIRRSLLGISQTALAESVDLTFQQIQKYEAGKNRISSGTLYKFARNLGVSVSYFFPEQIEGNPNEYPKNLEIENIDIDYVLKRKETIELLKAYYNIKNPENRKAFLTYIKTLGNIT
ncbi:MAG: helix-turn-helix transcriptional regulator [Alphaproteobacteria bacterium]